METVVLTHGTSRIQIYLQGGQVTSFQVAGDELLWMSDSARFEPGAAIRGGIPLCWPWFGESLDNAEWPKHGFARVSKFELISHEETPEIASVTLRLDSGAGIEGWGSNMQLDVDIRLSDHLWMEMRTTNHSDKSQLIGAALHSYFRVSCIENVAIPSVTGLDYLDKTAGYTQQVQSEALVVTGEIDRVYNNPLHSAELVDSGLERRVAIEAWGNTDMVVWNPGPYVAASMADFDDEGYREMICIEPAMALENRVSLAPGETHVIGQTISRITD
jgi:D-hexose-6-phosphate mutarotase